ncbi:MAG: hypothetical protein WD046_03965 [Paracoccaceae bacterium]
MRSLILAPAATAAMAGAAAAGSAVYVAPAVTMVEEPMRSGSGSWLIPLAIIAILALTLTGGEDDNSTTQSTFE